MVKKGKDSSNWKWFQKELHYCLVKMVMFQVGVHLMNLSLMKKRISQCGLQGRILWKEKGKGKLAMMSTICVSFALILKGIASFSHVDILQHALHVEQGNTLIFDLVFSHNIKISSWPRKYKHLCIYIIGPTNFYSQ